LSAGLVLSWRESVTTAARDDGTFVVEGPAGRVSLRPILPVFRDALNRLGPPGEDENCLAGLIQEGDGDSLARWYYYVERLTQRGLLCQVAQAGGMRLATLLAISASFVAQPAQVVAGRRYVLSRFAYLRREGKEAVLESPLCHARVILNDRRAAALAAALTVPATAEELGEHVGGLATDAVAGLLTLLLRAGLLGQIGPGETCTTDDAPALQTWEFHDLLFHAHSRRGRSDAPYGATFRLAGRLGLPPALKPAMSGPTIDLYQPDLARMEREDPPLAWALEQRRSVREYDTERPLTERQLGEFLFRVARAKDYREMEVATQAGPVRMDFVGRPYPAGGSLYELEVYATVNRCANLAAGLYHYDAARHRLIRLCERTAEVDGLLRDAAQSTGIPADSLQVLLVLAARFPRVAWKYESIAYSLTLKHVGVVYQTMYLAATAMGLAPCAVGGGDADVFARAAGTDYYAETSVGEFLLASLGEPSVTDPAS
jgi:SagB-type dehydrogenase family enzyme